MSTNNNLATLAITSSILTAQDITDILQIQPTKSHEKGTSINLKNPGQVIRDKSSWLLQSKLSRELPIQEKLEEISTLIETNLIGFQTIEDRAEIEIYCSFFLKDKSDVFSLSSTIMRKISLITIDIIVAIYPCDHGED